MSNTKRNVAANLGGRGLSVLLNLLLVPLYAKFLGIEAYGLVGFYATLQAVFSRLDMGLSATLNREMARRSALPDGAPDSRNLLRTLETVYWLIALFIGSVVVLLAPLIAHRWVNPAGMSRSTIEQAIMTMGIAMAMQWPLALYEGGMRGLQKQVTLNAITATAGVVKGVGAILIVWKLSPTVTAFFTWQACVGCMHTLVMARTLWRNMPAAPGRPAVRISLIKEISSFAAGMTGISLVTLLAAQADRIVLSKALSLEMFGYYVLAGTAASGIYTLINPVFDAVLPGLCRLQAARDERGLAGLYHWAAQLMSVAVLPAAMVLCLFSHEVMGLWTRNPATAANTYLLVSCMAVGAAVHGLMHPPYGVQLAYGWTSLALYINVASVFVMVPSILYMATHHGAIGVAAVGPLYGILSLVITQYVMHRRVLIGQEHVWARQDVALPSMAAILGAGLVRWLAPSGMSGLPAAFAVAAAAALSLGSAALAAPATRNGIARQLSRLSRKDPAPIPVEPEAAPK